MISNVALFDSELTASQALATDALKNLISVPNTGTGNNVLYGESSDANCIMSVRDSGSSTNVGYGCISNAHVFFNDGTEIARFSTGSGDKYSYSSAGLGGSGTNLHLHSDDSEIRMAYNIIHSDNSGNTKFTIRTHCISRI